MFIPGKILSKAQRIYKHWQTDLSALLDWGHAYYKNARGARILSYHGICRQDHTRFNSIFLQLNTFEAHLQYYKKYFNVVSLDDYYQQRFRDDRFNICITFDDGFANNYKYVLPLLEQYQVPATFFVTAIREAGYDILWNDFLGMVNKYGPAKLEYGHEHFLKSRSGRYVSAISGKSLTAMIQAGGFDAKTDMMRVLYPLVPFRETGIDADYWLQMTPEQLRELSVSPFASIGCHSYYHNDLAKIPIHDAREEMIQSKKYLESITGKTIRSIAFPYGSYSPAVVAEAKAAGFDQLLAMDFFFPADHADPVMRERMTINPFISVHNQLYAIIKGKYE